MRRLFIILVLIALVGYVVAWFGERPGSVRIDWLGYRIDTSIGFVLFAFLAFLALFDLLLRSLSAVWRAPRQWQTRRALRHHERGLEHLTQTLSQLSLGELNAARHSLAQARQHLPHAPITDLLGAHLSLRSGEPVERSSAFARLEQHESTRTVAVRARVEQLLRESRHEEALAELERGLAQHPNDAWLQRTQLYVWLLLERPVQVLDAPSLHRLQPIDQVRLRAIAYTQQASMCEGEEAMQPLRLAIKADPRFLPPYIALIALERASGERRRAIGILKKAWRIAPHPLLTDQALALAADYPWQKGLRKLRSWLNDSHRSLETYLAGARYLASQGEETLAIEWAETGIELRRTQTAMELLAGLYEKAGRPSDAIALRATLPQAEPEAAWVCEHCGQWETQWRLLCRSCLQFDSFRWLEAPRPASPAPTAISF